MNGMAVFSLSIKLYIKWINDFWYYSYCSIQQKKCTFPFIDYVILSLLSYTLLQVYPYMKSMFASLSFPPSGAVAGGYGLANGNTHELVTRIKTNEGSTRGTAALQTGGQNKKIMLYIVKCSLQLLWHC